MVGVDDDSGILKGRPLFVGVAETDNILVVVVGAVFAAAVGKAAQDGVGIGIALGGRLPAAVDKGVAVLGRMDGVHHDRVVAAGGIFHARGNLHSAGGQPVLLVLDGPGADRHIGQQVIEILVVLGIEHLVRAGQAGVADHAHVELSGRDDALEHIGLVLGIRLVQQALVAVARRPGLVGVDPGDDQDLVFDLLLDPGQPLQIIHDADLIVRGAGSDDQEELIAPAGKDLPDLRVSLFFDRAHGPGQGVHLLDLHRDRELSFKIHIHNICPLLQIIYVRKAIHDRRLP